MLSYPHSQTCRGSAIAPWHLLPGEVMRRHDGWTPRRLSSRASNLMLSSADSPEVAESSQESVDRFLPDEPATGTLEHSLKHLFAEVPPKESFLSREEDLEAAHQTVHSLLGGISLEHFLADASPTESFMAESFITHDTVKRSVGGEWGGAAPQTSGAVDADLPLHPSLVEPEDDKNKENLEYLNCSFMQFTFTPYGMLAHPALVRGMTAPDSGMTEQFEMDEELEMDFLEQESLAALELLSTE